jgi:hypothetical protein
MNIEQHDIWNLLCATNYPVNITLKINSELGFNRIMRGFISAKISFIQIHNYLSFVHSLSLHNKTLLLSIFPINIKLYIDSISEFNKIDLPMYTENLKIISFGCCGINYDCAINLCWNNKLKSLRFVGSQPIDLTNLGYIKSLHLELSSNNYSLESLPETIETLEVLDSSKVDFHVLPRSIRTVRNCYESSRYGKEFIECYFKEINSNNIVSWIYKEIEIDRPDFTNCIGD